MMDTFTTSDGVEHLMGWGICGCHVYPISWRNAKSVGRCSRCREHTRPCVLGTSKEKAYEVFRTVNGKEPEEF